MRVNTVIIHLNFLPKPSQNFRISPDGRDIVIIGTDEYKAQVQEILNNLASQSGTGAQLIWDAINSGATLVIVNTSEDINNEVSGIGEDYQILTFNIDVASEPLSPENGRNGEPLEMPAEVTMAHELYPTLVRESLRVGVQF